MPIGIGAQLLHSESNGNVAQRPHRQGFAEIVDWAGDLKWMPNLAKHDMSLEALRTTLISAEMLWQFCNVPLGLGIRVLQCAADWEDQHEGTIPSQAPFLFDWRCICTLVCVRSHIEGISFEQAKWGVHHRLLYL